jgi:hypothetical protein
MRSVMEQVGSSAEELGQGDDAKAGRYRDHLGGDLELGPTQYCTSGLDGAPGNLVLRVSRAGARE